MREDEHFKNHHFNLLHANSIEVSNPKSQVVEMITLWSIITSQNTFQSKICRKIETFSKKSFFIWSINTFQIPFKICIAILKFFHFFYIQAFTQLLSRYSQLHQLSPSQNAAIKYPYNTIIHNAIIYNMIIYNTIIYNTIIHNTIIYL